MKTIVYLFLLIVGISACTDNLDEVTNASVLTSFTFIDSRDNHEYKWVKIENQTWMAENLAFLPTLSSPITDTLEVPCYYVYGYNGTDLNMAKANPNYIKYGVLYDWSAALTACPAGWYVPSDAEWQQLEMELGMTTFNLEEINTFERGDTQGTQLKSTSGWNNNGNGTNNSGFSGFPGGYRFIDGNFFYV